MKRYFSLRVRRLGAHLLMLGMVVCNLSPAFAQQQQQQQLSRVDVVNPATRSSQPIDQEYTKSILENTTEKFFLTELVDHLPASDKVPTPAKVLGYPIGT